MTPRELVVEVVRLRRGPDLLALPSYMTTGSAGMDLLADIGADVVLPPGGRQLVPTGIALAIPAARLTPEATDVPLVRRLDETISDVVAGGGGRLLLLTLKDVRKLALEVGQPLSRPA